MDLNRRDLELPPGRVIAYGRWGRPVVAFPSQQGARWDWEDRGLVGALAGLIEAGRLKLYCVDSFDSWSWYDEGLPLEERARRHGDYERWIADAVAPFVRAELGGGEGDMVAAGCSFGAYHAANFALKRADLFPLAICMSGVYDVSVVGWGERGDAMYFNNPVDYVAHLGGPHLDWLRGRVALVLVAGRGRWEDTTGALESTTRFRGAPRREGDPARARPLGSRRPARLALLARADRSSSAALPVTEHLIGLLLGTEDDWPRAFEALVERLGPVAGSTFAVERIVNEPFDLRARPRYSLVIDRLGWWYDLPREWLKKVALMDDVYLPNNPFTFQAMQKHSAYCAMMRLGLKVPETWMVPHKVPPENPRFSATAERYNAPFDLGAIAERVGYPLYLKPYDGGQWVGVTRVGDPADLHPRYDESGGRLMHLQAAVEGFDVFVRSLSIGAETLPMRFDPTLPLHERYQVDHGFLTPELGREAVTISRLVNAFFRWELNSCETIVRGGDVYPIDYANASPDVAVTSLHYYFPWAIKTLVKWVLFCAATGRRMQLDGEKRRYFEIGDRDDLSYSEKLERYRALADAYFQVAEYEAFCAERLPALDEIALEYFAGPEFDTVLVETVASTFPPHEHEAMVARHRGLVGAWVADQAPAAA